MFLLWPILSVFFFTFGGTGFRIFLSIYLTQSKFSIQKISAVLFMSSIGLASSAIFFKEIEKKIDNYRFFMISGALVAISSILLPEVPNIVWIGFFAFLFSIFFGFGNAVLSNILQPYGSLKKKNVLLFNTQAIGKFFSFSLFLISVVKSFLFPIFMLISTIFYNFSQTGGDISKEKEKELGLLEAFTCYFDYFFLSGVNIICDASTSSFIIPFLCLFLEGQYKVPLFIFNMGKLISSFTSHYLNLGSDKLITYSTIVIITLNLVLIFCIQKGYSGFFFLISLLLLGYFFALIRICSLEYLSKIRRKEHLNVAIGQIHMRGEYFFSIFSIIISSSALTISPLYGIFLLNGSLSAILLLFFTFFRKL